VPDEWDEPEDAEEEEIGPDDPDYDLSEARGYGYEPPQQPSWWPPPSWVIVTVSLVLVLALLLPALVIIALR
jgi:hypothetical protein